MGSERRQKGYVVDLGRNNFDQVNSLRFNNSSIRFRAKEKGIDEGKQEKRGVEGVSQS